jgi:AraC-like DNA-binding protein
MPRLSKRSVDGAEPAEKPRFVWDEALPRFGLLVHPSGRKVYVVQYRNAEGRSRRLSLGSHGVLTPEQARRIAAGEIAEELGYTDAAHFTRFFRQRAGVPPSAYREEIERARALARRSLS